MLIGIDIRIHKYTNTCDNTAVVADNEIITFNISSSSNINDDDNEAIDSLDIITFNYSNNTTDCNDGDDVGGTFSFIEGDKWCTIASNTIIRDTTEITIKSSPSSSSLSSSAAAALCYLGVSSFHLNKHRIDDDAADIVFNTNTNSYSHSLFKKHGSAKLSVELIPLSIPSQTSSSLAASTRKLSITINTYLISPNHSNEPKPQYKPIIHINSFNADTKDHNSYENDTNDNEFYENNNNTSYASLPSVLEDSLNVTDFLNNFNANNYTSNANNHVDDYDEDDELINTIVQHMALKEQQRAEKVAVAVVETPEKENEINKDNQKTKHMIEAEKNAINSNSSNVTNSAKVIKPSTRGRLNSRRGGNSKVPHKAFISRVDQLPDDNSQNTKSATINTQLLSNPNISCPNQVDYLFRLPLPNPNPDPILIVKK